MLRRLALTTALAAALAVPASATAVPYLSHGEAARAIGRNLHKHYSVDRGSLEPSCWRLARNRVRCYFEFGYQNGEWGCGRGTVRATSSSIYSATRVWSCPL